MPHFIPGLPRIDARIQIPGVGVELLALTAKLRQPGDGGIDPDQLIPGAGADNAIGIKTENFLKSPDRGFRPTAENAVHGGQFRNGGVILGDAVQLRLDHHHIGAGAAPAQGRAGIGAGIPPDGSVGHDLHVAVVASQDPYIVIPLAGQVLTAPLAQSFAGDGGAVAEFRRQRLHKTGTAEIVVEEFVHDAAHIIKNTASIDEILVVCGGIGDVEIIAPAPVEFRIHPVQGEGDDGQNIGPEGIFLPGGIDLAGGHVFDIVDEWHCHIGGIGTRRAQMDGDLLGYKGDHGRHGSPPRDSAPG